MITFLQGILTEKKPPFIVLDVNGIGYELQASMTTIYALPAVGNKVLIHTHMSIREDAQYLYGFIEQSERLIFRNIIKVSGVGPKLALAILSGMNVAGFIECIETRDSARLVKLPGVGARTADRLIIEMKDRLDKQLLNNTEIFNATVIETGNSDGHFIKNEATSALVALGYKQAEANKLVHKVYESGFDSETTIRMALQTIVK